MQNEVIYSDSNGDWNRTCDDDGEQLTRRESATAKEVVHSAASKIHSHPTVSQVEPGIEPATMIENR